MFFLSKSRIANTEVLETEQDFVSALFVVALQQVFTEFRLRRNQSDQQIILG